MRSGIAHDIRRVLIVGLQVINRSERHPSPLLLWSRNHIDREFLSRERLWPVRRSGLSSLNDLLDCRSSLVLRISFMTSNLQGDWTNRVDKLLKLSAQIGVLHCALPLILVGSYQSIHLRLEIGTYAKLVVQ